MFCGTGAVLLENNALLYDRTFSLYIQKVMRGETQMHPGFIQVIKIWNSVSDSFIYIRVCKKSKIT